MPHSLTLRAIRTPVTPFDALRMIMVYACALALIGAGPFLPGVAW